MEKLYDPQTLCATEHFDIKSYFNKYSAACKLQKETQYQEMMGKNVAIKSIMESVLDDTVNLNTVNMLAHTCNAGLLTCEGENEIPTTLKSTSNVEMVPELYKITDDVVNKLDVLKAKKELQSDEGLYLKFKATCGHLYEPEYKIMNELISKDLIPGSEMVVYVRVYRPFVYHFNKKNVYSNLRSSHEIKMLGSNTLADLRDKVLCNSDYGLCTEVQNALGKEKDSLVGKAKGKYPSGFIFIDGVFYNDFRHPDAIDYSGVIKKWAQEKQIGEFKSAEMSIVRMVKDLKPRIGYPYIYQHQGDCEHIIVFTDMHLLTKNDCLISSEYPHYFTVNKYMSQYCNICGMAVARWLCFDGDRLPRDKSFMCHECFVSYNYVDGKKVGKFKAYPYYDNSSFM